MDELETKLRAAVGPRLDADESLEGVCIATQVGLFRGRSVALASTGRRLIVQGLNRRLEAEGEPTSLRPDQIARASAEGAGGGWPEIGAAIMDRSAVTLKLRTTAGEKLKLHMMRGTGPLGGLGGGETQRLGVEALARFFERAGS